jgi:hypothetical protein
MQFRIITKFQKVVKNTEGILQERFAYIKKGV